MESLLSNTRKPDITFHSNGRIDIAARIAHKLSLAKGDVIDVARQGSELYVYVKYRDENMVGRHELTCYPTNGNCGTFRTWSKRLVKAMMQLSGANQMPLKLPCGRVVERDEQTLITIIYRKIL